MWESRVPIELGCAHCPRRGSRGIQLAILPRLPTTTHPEKYICQGELSSGIPKSQIPRPPDPGFLAGGSLGRSPGEVLGGPWGGPGGSPGEGPGGSLGRSWGGPRGGVLGNLTFLSRGGPGGVPKNPGPKGWEIFGNLWPKGPVNVLVFAIFGLVLFWGRNSSQAIWRGRSTVCRLAKPDYQNANPFLHWGYRKTAEKYIY